MGGNFDMAVFDVSIVLTITADDEVEVVETLLALYNMDINDMPDWSAVVIKELAP